MLHVEFVGEAVKPFLQILGHCTKMCDSLHFEPHNNTLALRAIGRTKSTHLHIVLEPTSISRYSWTNPSGVVGEAPPENVSLTVDAASLVNSVMRHHLTLCRVTITHKPASSAVSSSIVAGGGIGGGGGGFGESSGLAEELVIRTESGRGLIRRYALHLDDTTSEKAHVPAENFLFEATCCPRMFGSFLSSFPSRTARLTLLPSNNRLTIRAAEDLGRSAGVTASVDQRQFYSFRTLQHAAQADPSTPYSTAAASSELVGKTLEQKVLRFYSFFVDQMQMSLRLLMGGAGQPVKLEAVHRDSVPSVVAHCSLLVAALDADLEEGVTLMDTHHKGRMASGRYSGGTQGSAIQATHPSGTLKPSPSTINPSSLTGGGGGQSTAGPSMVGPSTGGGPSCVSGTPTDQQHYRQHTGGGRVSSGSGFGGGVMGNGDDLVGDSMISVVPSSGLAGTSSSGLTPASRMKRPRSTTGGLDETHNESHIAIDTPYHPSGPPQQQQQQLAYPTPTHPAVGPPPQGAPGSLFNLDFNALLVGEEDDEDEDGGGFMGAFGGEGFDQFVGGGPQVNHQQQHLRVVHQQHPHPPHTGGGGASYSNSGPFVVDRTQQYQ